MHVGEKIKSRREELRLTQTDLAKKARIGQPYISKIENQTIETPSITVLESLAQALKTDVINLVDNTNYSLSQLSAYRKGTLLGYCPHLQCPGSNFTEISHLISENMDLGLARWEPYKTPLFDDDEEPINFCVHCGTHLENDCHHCGRKIKQLHGYCPGCGKKVYIFDSDDVPF
jgi:transcriptional regulator with XRE-family HTH domain